MSMPMTQRRAAGMTLIEMLITTLFTTGLLFVLVGWMSGMQREAKTDLAVRQLAQLDLALSHYYGVAGDYPRFDQPDSASLAVEALNSLPKAQAILDQLPGSLWQGSTGLVPVDPWGMPLRYVGSADSPRVQANGGRPIFVSAGPNRRFGSNQMEAGGDDLRSDDPDPDDFFQALREAAISEEK